eukprot:1054237-Pyramimonas_sp.AAC.1
MKLALGRISWSLPNDFTFLDDFGAEFSLTATLPRPSEEASEGRGAEGPRASKRRRLAPSLAWCSSLSRWCGSHSALQEGHAPAARACQSCRL